MNKSETLLAIALIIAGISLLLSFYSFYTIKSFESRIAGMENEVMEVKRITKRMEPMVSQYEWIEELMPRLNQFVQTLPPTEEEE